MVAAGDHVKFFLSDETFEKFSVPEGQRMQKELLPKVDLSDLPFEILYETKDILVIDKPFGMLSQKASASDVSANEYILSYLAESGQWDEKSAAFRPSVCNRLDRNTSGVLAAGKTLKGLQELSESFKQDGEEILPLYCGRQNRSVLPYRRVSAERSGEKLCRSYTGKKIK